MRESLRYRMHAGDLTARGMLTCFGTMAAVKRWDISKPRQRPKSSSKCNCKLGMNAQSYPAIAESVVAGGAKALQFGIS